MLYHIILDEDKRCYLLNLNKDNTGEEYNYSLFFGYFITFNSRNIFKSFLPFSIKWFLESPR